MKNDISMGARLIDDFTRKISSVPFCQYHFVHTILSNTILSVYHFVHTILSVPFCPRTPRTTGLEPLPYISLVVYDNSQLYFNSVQFAKLVVLVDQYTCRLFENEAGEEDVPKSERWMLKDSSVVELAAMSETL